MTRFKLRYDDEKSEWEMSIYATHEKGAWHKIVNISHEAYCGLIHQLVWSGLTRMDTDAVCDVTDSDCWEPDQEEP